MALQSLQEINLDHEKKLIDQTYGQTALQMDRLGSNQPLFLFASVTFASYLVSVLTIRYYFSMKGRL